MVTQCVERSFVNATTPRNKLQRDPIHTAGPGPLLSPLATYYPFAFLLVSLATLSFSCSSVRFFVVKSQYYIGAAMQRSRLYDPIMYTGIPLQKFYSTSEPILVQGEFMVDFTKLSEA